MPHLCTVVERMYAMGDVYKYIFTKLENSTQKNKMKCAFCQQVATNPTKELKRLMKKKIPLAFMQMAFKYKQGEGVIQSDTKALEMITRAAELGHDAEAFVYIGQCYEQSIAVEESLPKAVDFLQVAAKKGSFMAHQYIANFHGRNGNNQIGENEHLKVAASAGCQEAMDSLMNAYKDKLLSKEELTQTLRAFQASNSEMMSNDREDARLLEESRKTGEAPPAGLFNILK